MIHSRSIRALAIPAAALSLVPALFAQDCTGTSVGFVPLNDLAEGQYMGFQGGLYPGGELARPQAHDAAGIQQAGAVVPRGPGGAPNPNGKIVLLSIGLSNTTQEFQRFIDLANADPELNEQLVVVDGAQGGQAAEDVDDPAAPYWSFVANRLATAGVTAQQVQVIWLKTANRSPMMPFPTHAQGLQSNMHTIVQIVRQMFPNARLGYVSTRIYAGYAVSPLNPEPFAYESGFSAKWLIEDQINGDPTLNFDPTAGTVEAPWLAWGPYLWADGLRGRSDGLIYECSDMAADGTHPGPGAREKVAQLLLEFFRTDGTAQGWFFESPPTQCPVPAIAQKYGVGLPGALGTPKLVASRLPTVPTESPVLAHVFDAPPTSLGLYVVGPAPLPVGAVPIYGGSLLVNFQSVFPAVTDGLGRADLSFGLIPDDPALCGLQRFVQFGVLDPTAPQGVGLSRGLRFRLGH